MAKLINKDYLTRQFYLYNEEYLKPKVEELEGIKNSIQTDISGLAIKSFSQTNNTGSGEKNTITETLINGKIYDFYVYNGQGIAETSFSSTDKNTTGRKKYTLTIKSSNENTLPTISQDFYDGVGINSMFFTTSTIDEKRNKYTLTIKSTDEEAVKTITQDFYDGIGIYNHKDEINTVDGITTHTYKIDYTDGTSDSIILNDPTLYVKNSINSINTTLATKVNTVDVIDNLISTETTKPLSANQGKILSDKIDTELTKKINTSDIVDTLDSDSINKPLSANQGRVLNEELNTKINTSDVIDTLDSDFTDKPLSANQGKILSTSINSINTTLAAKQNTLTVSNPLVLSKDALSLSLDKNTLGVNSNNQLYVVTATDTEIEIEFDNT